VARRAVEPLSGLGFDGDLSGEFLMRTLVFVDEANFQKSAFGAGYRPDLVALRDYLRDSGRRELIEMVVYIGLPPERRADDMPENWQRAYDSKHRLRLALQNHGIMVISWRGKQLFGHEPPRFAANIDMLMAMDALELSLDIRPDIVVLVTGDGDFSYLANKLRRRGIRVEAAALPNAMSGELRRAVHQTVDLTRFFESHGERLQDRDSGGWDDDHDDI
jgi:uncharacterized LabA/DUF88 family protein